MTLIAETAKLPYGWSCFFNSYKTITESLDVFYANQQSCTTIYPSLPNIFKAFQLCDLRNVKVVILGQDPYHGVGQAHGLSFSVPQNIAKPPSLKNIEKSLCYDFGLPYDSKKYSYIHDLTLWAEQGVLLLNSILTVEAHKAGSHRDKGWEIITDKVIETISATQHHVVFILWGNTAISKKKYINQSRHTILESVHPSPLSAHRGFTHHKHFSMANIAIEKHDNTPIKWFDIDNHIDYADLNFNI